MLHRISRSQYRRTALNYAEVRRSLPQVSCSDNQNETQFCSASIQRLSAERPYLSIADLRLFAAGFFLAEKWFLHMHTERHSEKQDSQRSPEGSNFMWPLAVQQPTKCDQSIPLPSQTQAKMAAAKALGRKSGSVIANRGSDYFRQLAARR
jgi:hypothetical protein